MRTINKMLAVAAIVVAATVGANAQNNSDKSTKLNANYKHQFPTSKGNKFSDSFKNDNMEDVSVRNYKKQPKYKKTENSAFKNNFTNVQKVNTVNSKHPYGL